jgi:hypothetical protein
VKHGKPNHFHDNMENDPRGKPMDEWVKDVGKSESRSIMARIRVQYLPGTANSADAKAARLISELYKLLESRQRG